MYTFFKDFYQNEIFYVVGKVIKSFGESDQNTFSEKVCKYDQIYQIIVFGQIFTPFLSDSTKLHFWWIWLSMNNLGGPGNYWQSLEAFVDFLLLFQFVDLSLKNWRNGRKFFELCSLIMKISQLLLANPGVRCWLVTTFTNCDSCKENTRFQIQLHLVWNSSLGGKDE